MFDQLKNKYHELAKDKAILSSMNVMYSQLIKARGLENVIQIIFEYLMNLHGGNNITLYYTSNEKWRAIDIYNNKHEYEVIPDELVNTVITTGDPLILKLEKDKQTGFLGYDNSLIFEHICVFPLNVQNELFGVLRIDGMFLGDTRIITELMTFLGYAAHILYHEILNYRSLKNAYQEMEIIFNTNPDSMYIVDNDHFIVKANSALLQLLHKNITDVLHKKCYQVMNLSHCDRETCPVFSSIAQNKTFEAEITLHDENGDLHYCILKATPFILDNKFHGAIVNMKDITERKNYEDSLQKSLIEKDILLKEVHHRVKNNLQIISSLISLQIYENNQSSPALTEIQNRIMTMAIIHQKLYKSKDLVNIDISEYIVPIVKHLVDSYRSNFLFIDVNYDIEELSVNIDTAIPIGLIINEVISNSIKYAFPDHPNGTISITIDKNDSSYLLIIRDNGIGLPADVLDGKNIHLGLQLIEGLCRQLNGQLKIHNDNGAVFTITFTP